MLKKVEKNKIIRLFTIIMILMMVFSFMEINEVYAESTMGIQIINRDERKDEFKFKDDEYTLKEDGDMNELQFELPYNYTINDVEVKSENEEIAKAYAFFGKFYVESRKAGTTKIMARIKNTNYTAECTIKVLDKVILTEIKSPDKVGATIKIESTDSKRYSINTRQAIDICVMPLDGSKTQEEWIRLGEGIFGGALSKTYTYDIYENCIVKVRQISWWDGIDYDGKETELYRTEIKVDDIEPIASIGAKVKVYENDYSKNKSDVIVGNSIQLKASIVELPTDLYVNWKSYQTNVAEVDENGKVYAKREGTATIEAAVYYRGRKYVGTYVVAVSDGEVHAYEQNKQENTNVIKASNLIKILFMR